MGHLQTNFRARTARSVNPEGEAAIDSKAGSPWLDGLPAPYITVQLEAFADGTRRNDISEQMRNIARNMTPGEIAAAASYYANPTRR